MSGALPSCCVLDRRMRMFRDKKDEEDDYTSKHPLVTLPCAYKNAFGFPEGVEAVDLLRSLELEMRLADALPDLSSLTIRGGRPDISIRSVDKNLMIMTSLFPRLGRYVYVIYDAFIDALFMIPTRPGPDKFMTSLATCVAVARRDDGSYNLVLVGQEIASCSSGGVELIDSLFLWCPFSSAISSPWKVIKRANFPDECLADESAFCADYAFNFDRYAIWVDLYCGVMYCLSDDLLSDDGGGDDDPVAFRFIDLPVESLAHLRHNNLVSGPDTFRTMGIVQNSIKFVNIDGVTEHVNLKDRTVTVWRLLDDSNKWGIEYKLSLEDLWKLEGFNLPRDLTPMFPLLSTDEDDVVYFALGEYRENAKKGKFLARNVQYWLGVDMRHKILRTSMSAPKRSGKPDLPNVISTDFSKYINGAARLCT